MHSVPSKTAGLVSLSSLRFWKHDPVGSRFWKDQNSWSMMEERRTISRPHKLSKVKKNNVFPGGTASTITRPSVLFWKHVLARGTLE